MQAQTHSCKNVKESLRNRAVRAMCVASHDLLQLPSPTSSRLYLLHTSPILHTLYSAPFYETSKQTAQTAQTGHLPMFVETIFYCTCVKYVFLLVPCKPSYSTFREMVDSYTPQSSCVSCFRRHRSRCLLVHRALLWLWDVLGVLIGVVSSNAACMSEDMRNAEVHV